MATVRATSSNGGSTDEKSSVRPPPSEKPSSSSSKSKVNTVHPEVVTVQKDHMTLLLAKCRNQESRLQAYKNLQLVIKDAYTELEAEKKKSAKYQTSLIQAENRLTEMIRVQLENSALQHQLPFLADVQQKPVGRATRLPVSHGEQHRASVPAKPKTEPLIPSEHDTDIEVDGEATQDSAFISGSLSAMTSLGYGSIRDKHPASISSTASQGFQSMGKLEVDGATGSLSLSSSEYEEIIQKEKRVSRELELKVKELQYLMEAKSNNNMDAIMAQLKDAQRKIDELSTANKNKETLLQNYYQAYMEVTKQRAHQDPVVDQDTLENCSKDQLQHIIQQMRAHKQELRETHEIQLCEQRGLFLKEREKSNALEAKLKACQRTIDDLRDRRSTWDRGDFPLTMSELREKNQSLENTVKLHQGSCIKLSQEKERAVAALEMATSEMDKAKKERAELQKQVQQLSAKLQDPGNEKNLLQARVASMEQYVAKLEEDVRTMRTEKATGCSRCKQLEKRNSEQQKKLDNQKSHIDNQQSLIISLQQRGMGQDESGYASQPPLPGQPNFPQPVQRPYSEDRSSSHGGGGGAADDDELLECPRCYKEFRIEEVEKYQLHCQRCQDDE